MVAPNAARRVTRAAGRGQFANVRPSRTGFGLARRSRGGGQLAAAPYARFALRFEQRGRLSDSPGRIRGGDEAHIEDSSAQTGPDLWKAGFMFASVEHLRGLVGPIGQPRTFQPA